MLNVQCLDSVGLAVRETGKPASWYAERLGMKQLYEDVWGTILLSLVSENASVTFFPIDNENPKWPIGPSLRHIDFRVDMANFDAAQEKLNRRGKSFEVQDQTMVKSIYFSDPDGCLLEQKHVFVNQSLCCSGAHASEERSWNKPAVRSVKKASNFQGGIK